MTGSQGFPLTKLMAVNTGLERLRRLWSTGALEANVAREDRRGVVASAGSRHKLRQVIVS